MLRCLFFLFCLAALLAGNFLSALAQAAWRDPLAQWHWRNPLPQGNPLSNVSFCNGVFFALGPDGTMALWKSHSASWQSAPRCSP